MYGGYYFPGMYNIVGGNVSIFGGRGASKNCMQQRTSGSDNNSKWECVLSSETNLGGLGYAGQNSTAEGEGSGYYTDRSVEHRDHSDPYGSKLIRYSNFVL